MIEVVKFLSDPIGENAYLFFLEGEKRAVAVDPSYNAQAMLNYLKEEETQLEAILLTHGHFDHIAGVDVLREATGAPVYIHEADAQMLEDPEKNLSVITHRLFTIKPADRLLKGAGGAGAGRYAGSGAAYAGAYAGRRMLSGRGCSFFGGYALFHEHRPHRSARQQ